MKNALLITLLFLSTQCFGQDESKNSVGKTEFKLNCLFTVLKFPEISLERNFKHTSFGTSLGASLPNTPDDQKIIPYGFMLTPFFRYFFSSEDASGFFIEHNVSILSADVTTRDNNPLAYIEYTTQETRISLGFSLGGKHIFSNNMVLEYYTGFGRDISGNSTDYNPRIGVGLGWRFK